MLQLQLQLQHLSRPCGLLCAVLAGGALAAGGCTWQEAVYQTGRAPGVLRITEDTRVLPEARFRLPRAARVSVQPSAHVPEFWTDAAAAGVNRVFAGHTPDAPQYVLTVDWPLMPDQPRWRRWVTTASNTWVPLPARTETLRVHLHHGSGASAGEPVHSIQLHVRPSAWGQDWNRPEALQHAFYKLAADLKGV